MKKAFRFGNKFKFLPDEKMASSQATGLSCDGRAAVLRATLCRPF
jgi:hypothetical protein